ncbi:hypothetical protein B0H17DRAFT_1332813 [Mycena rosella]|uniref:DUF6534 domain-containing protein n=1 Tax=Mycena rosella TaxID=1033263 RepID=A0AAD7DA40_MYCRO|nr:hypothetical protein B0H17DRAFT_1332813 [Mycena rosella]
MNSGSAAPPGFQAVQFSGPPLVADLLHWGLFGTLSVQICITRHSPRIKSPSSVWFTLYTPSNWRRRFLITHHAFTAFGYGFGDISALNKVDFDWLSIPVMSGLVAFIGQSFYAYRIRILTKSWFVPILIVITALTGSVGAFLTGAFVLEAGNLTLLNTRKVSAAAGLWCGASAFSDVLIAVCMTYYLSRWDTKFRQTRVLISKIVRLTIETGSLTALVAVTALALFFGFPGQTYYVAATALIPKLYANSILVVLNARFQILGGRATYASTMDFISTPNYLQNTGTDAGSRPAHTVRIDREVESDGAFHDRVEMKGMQAAKSPDLAV